MPATIFTPCFEYYAAHDAAIAYCCRVDAQPPPSPPLFDIFIFAAAITPIDFLRLIIDYFRHADVIFTNTPPFSSPLICCYC